MASNIIALKDSIPSDLYELVERFAAGKLQSMHVTALNRIGEIEHYSFGRTPRPLADIANNKPCDVYEINHSTKAEEVTA